MSHHFSKTLTQFPLCPNKLSRHFTIANISKTWITEHLHSLVNDYIRKWLNIPISETPSNVFLERNKFGLNICPPSIKFSQCQTNLRNSLKESPNDSLKDLWKSSSCHTTIQYDVYKSTKEVLKDFRSNQEEKLQHHLTSQGFFLSNVIKYSLLSLNPLHQQLPPNTQEYGDHGHYHKFLIAPFFLILNYSFMLSLVVNGTLIALPRDTTQSLTSLQSHFNLQLMFTLHSMQMIINAFLNPSIITGENYRPDFLFLIQFKRLYVIELTVGFESNLNNNAVRNIRTKKLLT